MAIFKEYLVTVDTMKGAKQDRTINFNQNDHNTAKIIVYVMHDGLPLDLTDSTVKIALLKKDGTKVYQNGTITDPAVGEVELILSSQSLAVPGQVRVEVGVDLPGESSVVPGQFFINVIESIMSDEVIESTNEYPLIQKAIDAGETLTDVDLQTIVNNTETVNNLKTEVETARGTEASIGARFDSVNSQLAQNTNIIGFNFEQQGGVANDSAPVTARSNTTLLRKLMYDLSLVGGGTISFPKGTFYFAKHNEDEIIRAYSNVNVHGVGMEQTILKCIPETSQNYGYSFFRNLDGLENVNFRDFTVDMYDEDMTIYSSGGKAFYMQKIKNSTFKNLKLKGTPSTALGIDHLVNVHIDNVHAYECGRLWGVIPSTETTELFDPNNPASNNPFPGGAGIGIGTGELEGEHFKITNCTTELCGHYGIFVEHQRLYRTNVLKESKDIIIANNICRNNRFAGMGIRGGTRVSMTGNKSYGNGCFGLAIDSKGNLDPIVTLKDSNIIGNSFNDNGLDGIHIDGYCNINGLDIKSNKILRNGNYGVGLGHYNTSDITNTTQKNIVISGNTMYANGIDNIYQDNNRLVDYVNLVIENNSYVDDSVVVPTVPVVDDADERILYQGTGWTIVSKADLYQGKCHRASNGVALETYCKFAFSGTGFKWFTPTKNDKGKARVYVDYGIPTVVDLYTPDPKPSHSVYEIQGLSEGVHEVLIEYTGAKNVDSLGTGGNNITIDAFVITDGDLVSTTVNGKTKIEETDPNITYVGSWNTSADSNFSAGSSKYTTSAGSLEFTFTGDRIDVRVPTGSNKGKAYITIDGGTQNVVDMYSPTTVYNATVFSANNLGAGNHTIKIEYSGFKNAESASNTIAVDSFLIYNGDIVAV